MKTYLPLLLLFLLLLPGTSSKLKAQDGPVSPDEPADLARYTPEWIRDGFADAGATHEPWIFQVRRNNGKFNQGLKELYDYQTTEEYIKALAETGISVYHLYCYKGFGFEAEKAHMEQAAKAAAIAHSYGMKVDTYIQWNTMAYETFFAEVPEAKEDLWYQIDVYGKPILLTYSYQQSFRYRPCFNHDDYMEYFKEKIIRYAVEEIKTDFIHFDNFDFNYPPEADFNPSTIAAFRKYLEDKYSPKVRLERFGFEDVSYVQPPMWNEPNPADKMEVINDPVIQEWVDFRCWTFTTRLAECARFVRELNREVAIEVNPHGLVGSNRAWEAGINHPDLMQYTNVIWTEDTNNPRWENGVAIGKFRHYKLGRTTCNFIMTGNHKEQDFAENLALNRTIGSMGRSLPEGVRKKYLDFWLEHKDLYTGMQGGEKVAVLRSYPSMAYNIIETQVAVNMAEQALQQGQIPFDIIFDQQMEELGKYEVLVLANQESLSNKNIAKIKSFVKNGGGIVVTGRTGMHDQWRRLRPQGLAREMFLEVEGKEVTAEAGTDADANANADADGKSENIPAFSYGKGRVIYLPQLIAPGEEVQLGFESVWMMPENAEELESAVYWAAGKALDLTVSGPEWLGVSHDKQKGRDVIHLFNYHGERHVAGITLKYRGAVKKAWMVSPDQDGTEKVSVAREGDLSVIRIADLEVYKVLVLELEEQPVESAAPEIPRIEYVVPAEVQAHQNDPNVIWYDDFNQGVLPYMESRGDIDSTESFGGKGGAMDAGFNKGDVSGAGDRKLAFGDFPGKTDKIVRKGETFDEIYWRVYMKLEYGWEGAPAKMSRATSIVSEKWKQSMIVHVWSGKQTTLTLDPASGVEGMSSTIVSTKYNDFDNLSWLGNSPSAEFQIFDTREAGCWILVEAMAKLNTPGKSDGLARLWIDGRLEAERENMNLRGTYTDHGINAVFLESYWNDGSVKTQGRWYDNYVVSTAPIGPVSCPPNPVLQKTPYHGPGSLDCWEVQIATDSEGKEIVFESAKQGLNESILINTESGKFMGKFKGQDGLSSEYTYFCRVRQKSTGGQWSDWSRWHQNFNVEQ